MTTRAFRRVLGACALAALCLLPALAQAQGGPARYPGKFSTIEGAGNAVTVQPPGASVALPLSTLLDGRIDVRSFGASGVAGVDDAPAINAAIQRACAQGGGEVVLMRRHSIGAPLDNNCSGVLVRGIGGLETLHDSGMGVAGTLITPMPGFTGDCLWHRTRPASELGIAPAAHKVNTGGGFSRITVQGCRRNARVTSVRRGTYEMTLLEAIGTESMLIDGIPDYRQGAASQVGEAGDVQAMDFDVILRQYDDTTSGAATGAVNGIVFGGPAGGGNVSYNNKLRLSARVHNGTALVIQNGDNNSFLNFNTLVTGTGRPFLIQATVPGVQITDANYFDHYCATAPGKVEVGSERPNGITPTQTIINLLDTSNSCTLPTGPVTIVHGYPAWSTFAPAPTPTTGSFTGVNVAEARYRKDALSDTITFTATLSPSYTSASGNLRFDLPAPARSTGFFSGANASGSRLIWCRMEPSRTKGVCSNADGSPLLTTSGEFFVIGGTYETQ